VAAVVQNSVQPVVTGNDTFNPTLRVYFYEQLSGGTAQFSMQYRNTGDTRYRWNGSSWVTTSPAWAYTGAPAGTDHIAEIVSDNDEFYLVLRDETEAILTQTTPVAWADLLAPNNALWLVWGEPYNNYYHLEARSDWFCLRNYVSPEPGVQAGTEENRPTAVTLASFTAEAGAGHIALDWETAVELNNLGFHLYRSDTVDGPYVKLNDVLIPSQAPGSMQGALYTWDDRDVVAGATYYYKLESVDIYSRGTQYGPVWATAMPAPAYRIYLPLLSRP
jgi:hypothetical protein